MASVDYVAGVTFARWVNRKLRDTPYYVVHIEYDFSDGLKLIKLVEVLSKKKITEFNKEPASRFQKLDNVAIALELLVTEGVSVINICPEDIVDSNMKCIVELVWQLIISYSMLRNKKWKDDDWNKMLPKERLLSWIRTKVPSLKIKNLSTNWASGRAIAALVNAIEPRACRGWQYWPNQKSETQRQFAMIAANKWLSIQNLVSSDSIVFERLHEKAMVTYLSQFLEAKSATFEPADPTPIQILNLQKVVLVNSELKFCVRVEDFCLRWSSFTLKTTNMVTHAQIPTDFTVDWCENFITTCTPTEIGLHKIRIEFDGNVCEETFNAVASGFRTPVSGVKVTANEAARRKKFKKDCDQRIFIWGPGITQSLVRAFEPTHFRIAANNPTRFKVTIDSMDRALEYSPLVTKEKDGTYTVNYVAPESETEIKIQIELNGQIALGYPKYITVAPGLMFREKEWNTLPALSSSRAASFFDMIYVFGIPVPFLTKPLITAQVISPSDKIHDVPFAHSADSTVQVKYQPDERGQHQLVVKYNNAPVKGTPFKFQARGKNEKGPYAYGLGLSYAVAGTAAHFFLEKVSPASLQIEISGPAVASANSHLIDHSTLCYSYWANSAGLYNITIKSSNSHIKGSPFKVQVEPHRMLPFPNFSNFSQGEVPLLGAAPGPERDDDVILI